MKISFRYDDGVAVIPKKVLDKSAAQASREDLLVLLSLAADPAVPAAERTEALGIGKDELEQSISFWKRNKIISVELDKAKSFPHTKRRTRNRIPKHLRHLQKVHPSNVISVTIPFRPIPQTSLPRRLMFPIRAS